MNIARFLLGVTSIFAYPMDNYVSRHCVQTIIIKFRHYRRSLSPTHSMYYHPAVSNPSHSTTPNSSLPPSPHAHIPPRVIELTDLNKPKTFSNADIQVRRRAPSSTTIATSTTNVSTTNTTNIITDIPSSSSSTSLLSMKSPLQSFKMKSTKSVEDIEKLAIVALQDKDGQVEHQSIDSSRNLLSKTNSNEALNPNNVINNNVKSAAIEIIPNLKQNIPNNKSYDEISDIDDRYHATNTNSTHNTNVSTSISDINTDNNINYSYSYDHELPPCEYVLLSIFLWGVSLAFALVFTNLGLVLALTGAVAASVIGFVLPGLIYIRAYQIEFHEAMLFTFDIALSPSYYHSSLVNNNHVYQSAPSSSGTADDKINVLDNTNTVTNPMITTASSNNNSSSNHDLEKTQVNSVYSTVRASSYDDTNLAYLDTESISDQNSHISSNNSMNTDLENSITSNINETSAHRIKSVWQRLLAFYDFYLPVFLVLFGVTALITGVGTVLSQNDR